MIQLLLRAVCTNVIAKATRQYLRPPGSCDGMHALFNPGQAKYLEWLSSGGGAGKSTDMADGSDSWMRKLLRRYMLPWLCISFIRLSRINDTTDKCFRNMQSKGPGRWAGRHGELSSEMQILQCGRYFGFTRKLRWLCGRFDSRPSGFFRRKAVKEWWLWWCRGVSSRLCRTLNYCRFNVLGPVAASRASCD